MQVSLEASRGVRSNRRNFKKNRVSFKIKYYTVGWQIINFSYKGLKKN